MELLEEAKNLRKEIAELRRDLSLNKLKNTNQIKKKKKELARLLTVIRQREVIGH